MIPKLTALAGFDTSQSFDLTGNCLTVGRATGNAIRLDDRSVSKYHALLVAEDGQHRLFDLHSSNGTYVNAERVTVVTLKPGDEVRFGIFVFSYETEPAIARLPVAAPPPETPAPMATVIQPAPTVVPEPAPAPPAEVRLPVRPRLGMKPAELATPTVIMPSAGHGSDTPPPMPTEKRATGPVRPAKPSPAEERSFIRLPGETKDLPPPAKKTGFVQKLLTREKPAEAPPASVPVPTPRIVAAPAAAVVPPQPVAPQPPVAIVTPPPPPSPVAGPGLRPPVAPAPADQREGSLRPGLQRTPPEPAPPPVHAATPEPEPAAATPEPSAPEPPQEKPIAAAPTPAPGEQRLTFGRRPAGAGQEQLLSRPMAKPADRILKKSPSPK